MASFPVDSYSIRVLPTNGGETLSGVQIVLPHHNAGISIQGERKEIFVLKSNGSLESYTIDFTNDTCLVKTDTADKIIATINSYVAVGREIKEIAVTSNGGGYLFRTASGIALSLSWEGGYVGEENVDFIHNVGRVCSDGALVASGQFYKAKSDDAPPMPLLNDNIVTVFDLPAGAAYVRLIDYKVNLYTGRSSVEDVQYPVLGVISDESEDYVIVDNGGINALCKIVDNKIGSPIANVTDWGHLYLDNLYGWQMDVFKRSSDKANDDWTDKDFGQSQWSYFIQNCSIKKTGFSGVGANLVDGSDTTPKWLGHLDIKSKQHRAVIPYYISGGALHLLKSGYSITKLDSVALIKKFFTEDMSKTINLNTSFKGGMENGHAYGFMFNYDGDRRTAIL